MFVKSFVAAMFAGLAAAQIHKPVGDTPSGNPITRPLLEVVPAGKPFTITWTPTTPNTVSLLLLKGPSNNVVPVGAPIAEGIPNSGSFTWTPPSTFGASNGPSGYGIQLIDDVTGQYQYSTQFGISVSADASATPSAKPSPDTNNESDNGYGYGKPAAPTSAAPVPVVTPPAVTSLSASATTLSASVIYGTGYANSSIVQPTKSISIPSSLLSTATGVPIKPSASATTAASPEFTGAAAHLKAGCGFALGVAGLIFAL